METADFSLSVKELSFISRRDMNNVYEVPDGMDLAYMAYQFFMNHDSEVLYFLKNGVMDGVFSIGDLDRYYLGNK